MKHRRTQITTFLLTLVALATACGGEDNDPGDLTAGTDAEPPATPEECAPFEGSGADTGTGDGGGASDGDTLVCLGEAFGILRFEVCDDLNCVTGAGGPNADSGCFPFDEDDNLQDLEDGACPMPLALPAGADVLGDIPTPLACCTDGASQEDIEDSCLTDCAFAACKLASDAFAQEAQKQLDDGGIGTSNAAADLQFFSDQLAIPANLLDCANRVKDGELIDLGDGVPNTNEAGDIVNMTLELSCSITGTTAGGDMCTETPNFEESAEGDRGGGIVVGGLVSLSGDAGNADASVTGIDFGLTVEPCSGATCGVSLTSLRLQTSDVFLGPLQLNDIEVSLLEPAMGIRNGEEVIFGTLVAVVTGDVSFFEHDLGTIPVVITTHGPTLARLTADDMFEVVEANFRVGTQAGTLSLDPAPVTFSAGE